MSALLTHRQLERYKRPSKYSGLTQFNYSPKGTDLEFECWVEHSPSERGSRGEWGLQMEPDYPEEATLCFAEVNGEDIAEILNQATIDEIEEAFLTQETD